MKESIININKAKRFTFNSEQDTLVDSGVCINSSFFNGICTFNGSSTKITYSKVFLGIKSIRIKFKPSTTTQNICKLTSTHSISAITGTLSAIGFSTPIIYNNGIVSSTITTGWNDVAITTATAININDFIVGFITGYYTGEIELIEFYKDVLTLAEIKLLYTNSNYKSDDQRHVMRVVQDSGTVVSPNITTRIIRMLKQNNLYKGTRLLWDVNSGYKITTSGLNKYIGTAYSANKPFTPIDLTQTGADSIKPRLVGGIAPNSKFAASNQNGEARYFTHPPISFAAGDAWSVNTMINFAQLADNRGIYGGVTNPFSVRFYEADGMLRIFYGVSNVITTVTLKPYVGKFALLSLIYDNGTLKIYINAVLKQTLTISITASFDCLMNITSVSALPQFAKYNYHRIQSGAMTAAQVLSESTFLTSLYPEIESTVIGTQTWATRNFEAVCTPMGNIIPEMQTDAAVEKITVAADRDFSSDTGFWTLGTGVTISGNTCNSAVGSAYPSLYRDFGSGIAGKWIKITYDVVVKTSGILFIYAGGGAGTVIPSALGTNTFYIKAGTSANSMVFSFNAGVFVGSIDNLSYLVLGWSNATEIYDAVYAATAGTAAQKHYAACKEAGFWCYYGNDSANGAIYGKLYNWYAVSLFNLDMATDGFGWHVPTSTEFTTLQTYLGGAAVAGGKMKMTGTDYWTTPNTGADNTSGFTALGNGIILTTGLPLTIKSEMHTWCIDTSGSDSYRVQLALSTTLLGIAAVNKIRGMSLRIIKN